MARQTGTRLSTSTQFRSAAGRAEAQAARLVARSNAAGISPAARQSLMKRAMKATARADRYHVKASKLKGGKRDQTAQRRAVGALQAGMADRARAATGGSSASAMLRDQLTSRARTSGGPRINVGGGAAAPSIVAPRESSPILASSSDS